MQCVFYTFSLSLSLSLSLRELCWPAWESSLACMLPFPPPLLPLRHSFRRHSRSLVVLCCARRVKVVTAPTATRLARPAVPRRPHGRRPRSCAARRPRYLFAIGL